MSEHYSSDLAAFEDEAEMLRALDAKRLSAALQALQIVKLFPGTEAARLSADFISKLHELKFGKTPSGGA